MADAPERSRSSPGAGGGSGLDGVTGLLLPAALSLAVLLLLDPGFVFRNTLPALTDLPGHLLPPTVLVTELLPTGAIHGWSMDWFAGFPVYYFYFPLPGLFTGLLAQIVDGPLALRIAMVLPLLGLPWALWAFARSCRLGTANTVGLVVGGSGLLVMGSFAALGGNIRSTLSGEYYYGWSLVLTVVYLGLVAGAGRRGKGGWLAGAVLAAAMLSHVLPVIAACVGLLPFLWARHLRRGILESWVVAAVLTAFWTVPLILRLRYVGDSGWAYAPGLGDVLPLEVLLLLPAAAAGVGAVVAGRESGLAILVSAGLAGVVLAAIPQSFVVRVRLLPMWFLAIHVLAGVGLAWAVSRLRSGRWRLALPALALGGGAALVMLTARGVEPWRLGYRDVLAGLPERPGWSELEALTDRLSTLPPGRVHVEPGAALERWGHIHAFSLIPLQTEHTLLGGLLPESAPLHSSVHLADAFLSPARRPRPFPTEPLGVELDPPGGLARLRMMGARYLITHSAVTRRAVKREAGLPVGRFGDLTLFDLGEAPIVSSLSCVEGIRRDEGFREQADAWVRSWRPGSPFQVAGGPWERQAGDACMETTAEPVQVLVMDDEHIRFRTDHPGRPHLVRVSYFPNWRAIGASGPYLATPWFMVVVPEREVVDLYFGTTAVEWAGWILTLTGIAALGLTGLRARAVASRPAAIGQSAALGSVA